MKRAIFLLAALVSTTTAAAQSKFSIGLRGGINRASTTLDGRSTGSYAFASYSGDKSAIFGWQAGAVIEIAFDNFALQPAVLFSQKGEQFHTGAYVSGVAGRSGSETQSTNRYNWLELPINVVYTVKGVQVFGGPYVAKAVGGRQYGTSIKTYPGGLVGYERYDFDEKVKYGSSTENRLFDAGINFGLGYRKGPLQVQLGYGQGWSICTKSTPIIPPIPSTILERTSLITAWSNSRPHTSLACSAHEC